MISRLRRTATGLVIDEINSRGRVVNTQTFRRPASVQEQYVDPIMWGGFNTPEPDPVVPVSSSVDIDPTTGQQFTTPVAAPADPEEDPEAFAGPGTTPAVSNVPEGGGYHVQTGPGGYVDPYLIGADGTGGEQPSPTEYEEPEYWTDSTTGISYQFIREKVDRKWRPDTDKIVFDTDAGQQAYDNRKSLYWGAAGPVVGLERARLEKELDAGENPLSVRFSDLQKISLQIQGGDPDNAIGIVLRNMRGLPSGAFDTENWEIAKENALGILSSILEKSKETLLSSFNAGQSDDPWGLIDTTFELSPFYKPEREETSVPGSNIGKLDAEGKEIPAPTDASGTSIYSAGSYSSVPWNPIYKDFLQQNFGAGGNPAVYSYHAQQGLSNNPLQRTAYTQFLVQGTEDDPWGGKTEGGQVIGGLPSGGRTYDLRTANADTNVYSHFLSTYVPLEGEALTGTIEQIIGTLRRPESGGENTWIPYNPSETGYNDIELRDFRWRDRFGFSPQASQNQEALAALPIMQNTPALLRNETANILSNIHDKWQANPGRDPNEGWLEFVHRNDYFGMMSEQEKETMGSGLSPGG